MDFLSANNCKSVGQVIRFGPGSGNWSLLLSKTTATSNQNTGRCLEIGISRGKTRLGTKSLLFRSDKGGRPEWIGVRTLSHPEIGTNSLCESEFTSDRKDHYIVCGKRTFSCGSPMIGSFTWCPQISTPSVPDKFGLLGCFPSIPPIIFLPIVFIEFSFVFAVEFVGIKFWPALYRLA